MRTKSSQQKVIIIGAGIAGCSTAFALAKRGIQVTLVEQHAMVASEASGNPVAMLYPKYSDNNDSLGQFAKIGFKYTLDLLAALQKDESMYQLCGQVQLAFNQREHAKLLKLTNDAWQQIVSKEEASEIAGIPLNVGGLFLPKSGWVNPRLLCQALIASPHINLVMNNKALIIKQSGKHWQVTINKQTLLEADAVVACNANALRMFSQCKDIPMTIVRGQVNFFNSNIDSEKMNSILCAEHYLSPAINGQHSVGTSYDPNDLNAELSAIDTQNNLTSIKTISPWLFEKIDRSQINGRVGWRCAIKDYFPLAGQMINHGVLNHAPPRYNETAEHLPWLTGFYVNTGHGSKGMITAPICGEIVAAMISGEGLVIDSTMTSKLNPSRFALKTLSLKKLAQNLYAN